MFHRWLWDISDARAQFFFFGVPLGFQRSGPAFPINDTGRRRRFSLSNEKYIRNFCFPIAKAFRFVFRVPERPSHPADRDRGGRRFAIPFGRISLPRLAAIERDRGRISPTDLTTRNAF